MLDFRSIDWHDEAERACDGKAPYGRDTARQIVARMRHAGDTNASAYRCPWGRENHWHVGHVPSVERLEEIAAAIRNRTNEGDTDE